jgi:hypothetical protein
MKEWTLGPKHERPDTNTSGVGQTAAPQRTFCAHCGAESAVVGARFCSACGLPLPGHVAGPAEPVGSSEAAERTPQLKRVIRVREFNSLNAYESWLRAAGTAVQIVNMSTTKRWGFWTGFLGGAKTYTVTFEEQLPDGGRAVSPSSARKDWLIASGLFLAFVLTGLILVHLYPPSETPALLSDQDSEASIVSLNLTCTYQDRRDVGLALCVHAALTNNTDEHLKLIGPELDFYDQNGGLIAWPNGVLLNFDEKHSENIDTLERLLSAHETVNLEGCVINNLGGHTAHSVMYKVMASGLANSLLNSAIENQSNCASVPRKHARKHSSASPKSQPSSEEVDAPHD